MQFRLLNGNTCVLQMGFFFVLKDRFLISAKLLLWPQQPKGLSACAWKPMRILLSHLTTAELLRCRDSRAGRDLDLGPYLIFCSSWSLITGFSLNVWNNVKLTSEGDRSPSACTLSAEPFCLLTPFNVTASSFSLFLLNGPFPRDQKQSGNRVVARRSGD